MSTLGDIERRRKLEKIRGKAPTGNGPGAPPAQLALDFAQQEAVASSADLVLSYDIDAGVLVCGATRKWKDAIKATTVGRKRFRFSKRLPDDCAWYIPGSRGKPLERAALEQAATELRGTGPEGPTVQVKHTERRLGTGPSFAEREGERASRAAERIERHEGRASRLEAKAADQFSQSRRAVQGIPAGQPILVGHHSEARHRRDVAKAQRKGFQGLETGREAKRAAGKAATAASREAKRTDSDATQRRIGRLEAELRKVKRNLYGHPGKGTTLRTEAAQGDYKRKLKDMERDLTEKIAYWAEQLDEQLGAGTAREWGPADFTVGGIVYGRHGWAVIKRVNKKSLSVDKLTPALRRLNPAKLPYDRIDRPATPEDDVRARREYADYFGPDGETVMSREGWKQSFIAGWNDAKAARKRLTPKEAWASAKGSRWGSDYPRGYGAYIDWKAGAYAQDAVKDAGKLGLTKETGSPGKKKPSAAVQIPVMAGGGKPTRLELKVLGYAQQEDARLPTAEIDRQVNNAMRRLKQAGYLEHAPRQLRGGEKRYRLATPKVKKKRSPAPKEYPPLRKLEQYHFGPTANWRGKIAYDNNGYTALTPTQSKILKTQKGATAWLEKRIGAQHMAEAFLDTPDERRSQNVKRGGPLRILAPGEPPPST